MKLSLNEIVAIRNRAEGNWRGLRPDLASEDAIALCDALEAVLAASGTEPTPIWNSKGDVIGTLTPDEERQVFGAQQAQPEMPTRKQAINAASYAIGMKMSSKNPAARERYAEAAADAVLALFRAEAKPDFTEQRIQDAIDRVIENWYPDTTR